MLSQLVLKRLWRNLLPTQNDGQREACLEDYLGNRLSITHSKDYDVTERVDPLSPSISSLDLLLDLMKSRAARYDILPMQWKCCGVSKFCKNTNTRMTSTCQKNTFHFSLFNFNVQ